MTTLRARQIVKEYRVGEASLRVLDGAELTLSAGEELAIVGPSGSGKSTLLYVLGGLDAATSGSVELLGTDLGQLDPGSLADFRNSHIGFVFQDHHLLPQLTALENVALPILARRSVNREDVAWAAQLLGDVGLTERVEHRPPQLSGGERQRVALARALVMRPAIVLADEPTGSLDGRSAEAVGRTLLGLARQHGVTLVCVTHSEPLSSQFRRVARLVDGRLVDERPPAGGDAAAGAADGEPR